jgi:hypothetical protein
MVTLLNAGKRAPEGALIIADMRAALSLIHSVGPPRALSIENALPALGYEPIKGIPESA